MGKIYFIADTHFGDERILRYENRPFDNAEEMDRELIRRWNAGVNAEATVRGSPPPILRFCLLTMSRR